MITTLYLFGFSIVKAANGGAAVYGAIEDVPTRKVVAEARGVQFPSEAAQFAFDLSNNPSRDDEWYGVSGGFCRSLSVGDVVEVAASTHSHFFLCLSSGWADITLVAPE